MGDAGQILACRYYAAKARVFVCCLSDMIDNSSLNIVEYSNGQYHLKALNKTSHFALRKEAVEREFSLLPMTLFEK